MPYIKFLTEGTFVAFNAVLQGQKGIPKKEVGIFQKYNPKNTVPTYVFGCKYVRTGNAYKTLDQEKAPK